MDEIILKTSIYSLDVIIAAANSLLDKAYFSLDKENDEIIVKITSKNESVMDEFQNELIKQSQLKKDFSDSKEIKEKLLKESLSN